MITFYTEADLVSFGKYLLSKERELSLRETNKVNPNAEPYEERCREVYHADLCNWKEIPAEIVSVCVPDEFIMTK